ncbi:aminotransferase class V-fold PLP-dependent enzyme [Anderseniella sp. Alg231-50]|uniref:aminotransferase class V-fold PLP-dependent enzyme n=1 Tax=Anderseniella sp. Alg231-50 TaxID=1922226 RepID=UPI000D551E6E
MRTYLDHNATSPIRPEAREAMLAALELQGNASSVHEEGRKARALIETARDEVARALGTIAPAIVFTGGGSESCNQALRCVSVDRLVVSAIEHPCVLEAAKVSGLPVDVLPVDENGVVDVSALGNLLGNGDGRALVSVMLANNETGAIQPVRDVVAVAGEHDALVHCDAVQAFGKLPVNFGLLGVDLLSVSAHKLGGPQGVGALVIRDGLPVSPLVAGGGQELRRRAGTENIAGIAGFAAAVRAAGKTESDFKGLQAKLESALASGPGEVVVFSTGVDRLSNTVCFALTGLEADTALMAFDLDGIAVSSGSACSSGKVQASHVLKAMGASEATTKSAIRVSLGWSSTVEDVNRFSDSWQKIAGRHVARAAAA